MLRLRLPLLVVATTTVALLAVSIVALVIVERQQTRDQAELLTRELDRVEQLLAESVLGETFLDAEADLMHLQFVSTNGTVVVPAGTETVIPLHDRPTITESNGHPIMTASRAWQAAGINLGTVRLAYDLEPALTGRQNLRNVLLLAGGAIALIAGLAGALLVSRQLKPLSSLAKEANRLDPSTPVFDASGYGQDEVGSVAKALEHASKAIAERTLAERRALGTVAHELGAPLSVIAGQLEALSEESDDTRLHAARDAANELLYTSQDLLALAQGELRTRIQLEVTSLSSVAESVARSWASASVTGDGGDLILGSPPRLAQIIRNLLRNAYQSGASQVQVHVQGTPANVRVTVSDDGPGIEPKARSKVFDRDYTDRTGGNGIGLAVVRQLVEAHDGTVAVGETAAGGAEFVLEFPSLEEELG